MKDRKAKLKGYTIYLAITLTILVFIEIFTSLINIMSFTKNITLVYVNSQKFAATEAVSQIEYVLDFGKSIDKYYGLDDVIKGVVENSDNILGAQVYDENNSMVSCFGSEEKYIDLQENDYKIEEGYIYTHTLIKDKYTLQLVLDETYINNMELTYFYGIVKMAIILFLASIVVLTALYILASAIAKKSLINFLSAVGITVLIIVQCVYGVKVLNSNYRDYKQSINYTYDIIYNSVKADINKITSNNIKFNEVVGFDQYLIDLSDKIPEIEKMELIDDINDIPTESFTKGEILQIDKAAYRLDYEVAEDFVSKKIVNYAIDTAIVMSITILLSIEISVLVRSIAKARVSKEKIKSGESISMIRMLIYLLYLSVNMTAGLIAIISYSKYKSTSGIAGNSEFWTGLPITLEMIGGVLSIALAGYVISKLNFKKAFLFSIIVSFIGLFLSGTFDNIIIFSIARFISGYGIASITVNGRILAASQEDKEKRTSLLSNLTGGSISGYSCGVVLGGLLADRLSYNLVFIISAVITLIISLLLWKIDFTFYGELKEKFSISSFVNLLKLPSAFLYLIMIIIPIYSCSMFLSYTIPLFEYEVGLSKTAISGFVVVKCFCNTLT